MLSSQTNQQYKKALDFSQTGPENGNQYHSSLPVFSSTQSPAPVAALTLNSNSRASTLLSPPSTPQPGAKFVSELRPKIIPSPSPSPGSPTSNQTVVSNEDDSPKQKKKKRKTEREEGTPESKSSSVLSPKKPRNRSVMDISIKVDQLVVDLKETKTELRTIRELVGSLSAQLHPFFNNLAQIESLRLQVSSLEVDIHERDSRIAELQAIGFPYELPETTSPLPPANNSSSPSTHHFLNHALSSGATRSPAAMEEELLATDSVITAYGSGDNGLLPFFNTGSTTPPIVDPDLAATSPLYNSSLLSPNGKST